MVRIPRQYRGTVSKQTGLPKRRSHSMARQSGRMGYRKYTASAKTPALSVSILTSIHDIAESEWNAIIGANSIVRSHRYLAAVEQAGIAGCEFFYPVVRDKDGNVVAHACVYVIDTDFAQLLPRMLTGIAHGLRSLWPRFLIANVTECASPLSASHSISLKSQDAQQDVVGQLAAAIETIAQKRRSRLMVVRDFLANERDLFRGLSKLGYNQVSNMPLARIRVRWDSYADYLRSMRSRYRKDLTRRLRRAERSGQRVCVIESFAEQANRWAAQARTVWDKTKGFKREVLPCGYYEQMDANLGERSVLVAAERNGDTVAHGMILHDDSHTIATYFGRDRGPANQEWFHLVNEVIKIGIERKSQYINLGLGSYDAKQNVGADIEPLFVYSKSTLPWVNWLMRLVPRTMDHEINRAKRVFRD